MKEDHRGNINLYANKKACFDEEPTDPTDYQLLLVVHVFGIEFSHHRTNPTCTGDTDRLTDRTNGSAVPGKLDRLHHRIPGERTDLRPGARSPGFRHCPAFCCRDVGADPFYASVVGVVGDPGVHGLCRGVYQYRGKHLNDVDLRGKSQVHS